MFCRKVTDLDHHPPERCIEFYRTNSGDIGFDTRKHRHRLTTSEACFLYYHVNGESLSTTIPWQPWTDEDIVCPPTDAAVALARIQVFDADPVQCLLEDALFEPDLSLRSTPLLPELICVAHVTDRARSCFQLDALFFGMSDRTIRPGTSIASPAAWSGVVFATRRIPVQAFPTDTTIFEAQSPNGDLLYLQTNNSLAEVALPEWVPRFPEHRMHAEPSRVDSRLAEGVNQYNRMPEIYTLGANSFCEWDHQSREQPSHPEPSYAYSSLVAVSQVNEESGTSAWITTPQPNKHLTLWEDQQQTIDSMDHIDAGDSTDNHVQQQLNITDTLSNLESFPDPSEGQRPTPLTTLLTLALRGSSGKKMMTKDLCQALIDRFTWFKEHEADETWKARAQSDSEFRKH